LTSEANQEQNVRAVRRDQTFDKIFNQHPPEKPLARNTELRAFTNYHTEGYNLPATSADGRDSLTR
jgi:hypothetical protein